MSQMHAQDELRFDLVDRLHKSLRIAGMSATSLALALGLHRNTVNNYLSGKITPDKRTKIAWALATHVPFEWLDEGTTPTGPDGPDGIEQLPRLDSNQQPFGYLDSGDALVALFDADVVRLFPGVEDDARTAVVAA